MYKKILHSRFIKYLFWSGFFAWLDIVLLYIFTEYLGFYHLTSSIFSFSISLILWFLYQKYITFGDKHSNRFFLKLIKFAGFQIASYFIYVFVLWFGTEKLGVYYILVAWCWKIITFLWNYYLNMYFNFSLKVWK